MVILGKVLDNFFFLYISYCFPAEGIKLLSRESGLFLRCLGAVGGATDCEPVYPPISKGLLVLWAKEWVGELAPQTPWKVRPARQATCGN